MLISGESVSNKLSLKFFGRVNPIDVIEFSFSVVESHSLKIKVVSSGALGRYIVFIVISTSKGAKALEQGRGVWLMGIGLCSVKGYLKIGLSDLIGG